MKIVPYLTGASHSGRNNIHESSAVFLLLWYDFFDLGIN